ncbi:hypothetical protein PAXRUDRAFT_195735 [Paxillus rubicundulus Ve08.2h10]|uniref:Uncharacterized protein n=1 Tax=Paxillus rubicundulus Ve08.2h10 TaxID=930991 RepID=A0A0D0CZZ1_9AGAM|nr:hypothetical protein PAXRUDRAFT_195735 [Paxillus rubicundulus Ve08.2h10]
MHPMPRAGITHASPTHHPHITQVLVHCLWYHASHAQGGHHPRITHTSPTHHSSTRALSKAMHYVATMHHSYHLTTV